MTRCIALASRKHQNVLAGKGADTVFLIVYPRDGWILQRLATGLLGHLPGSEGGDFRTLGLWETGSILDNGPQPINYYLNYAIMRRQSSKIDAAWFTYPEDDGLFWRCARTVYNSVDAGHCPKSIGSVYNAKW